MYVCVCVCVCAEEEEEGSFMGIGGPREIISPLPPPPTPPLKNLKS